MTSNIRYNREQRQYYNAYVTEVKELTNRQLLKAEREEREYIADICTCENRQQGNEHMYYLGDDLYSVKKWALKNHAVTVQEIEQRRRRWKTFEWLCIGE